MNIVRIKFCLLALCALIACENKGASIQDQIETPKHQLQIKRSESDLIHDRSIRLSNLPLDDVKQSGSHLMELAEGLHLLERELPALAQEEINLMIHGYDSRGYEWIYPAHKLAERAPTYLYRWDWKRCPAEGASQLLTALMTLSKRYPNRRIQAFGHSYGGVILAIAAAQYQTLTTQDLSPLTAHLIASPLAGHPTLEARCSQSIQSLTSALKKHKSEGTEPQARNDKVKIKQWRTLKELDGAFSSLETDPQIVDWRGEVTRLPESYQGQRLGHNWSISAVVDRVLDIKPQKISDRP